MPYQVDQDPLEKHDECVDAYGECPHWLLEKSPATVKARVRGVSPGEFEHQDVDAEDYLDALEAAERERDVSREMLFELVDEQRAVVAVRRAPDLDSVRGILKAEVEGPSRRRVVAEANRRMKALK